MAQWQVIPRYSAFYPRISMVRSRTFFGFFWKVRKKSPQIHVSPLSKLDHGARRVGHLFSFNKANIDF
jgi:hypothetical protein